MATKKKSPKKKTTSRSKSAARTKNSKSAAAGRSSRFSARASSTKSSAKKPAPKSSAKKATAKPAAKAKPSAIQSSSKTNKAANRSTPRETPRVFRSSLPTRGESQSLESNNVDPRGVGARSGGQSGDLQGLSDMESADSESVGELLEEGNAFEAEIVKGVQDAPDADESEVQTHQGRDEVDTGEDFREN